MKKIININLSGRVIPIEDSAYESLQRYIESLRRYFAAEEGRDEIINDIESRIAELMNDKVKKGAPAVTDADIEEIINSMGRIEDFEEAGSAENAGAHVNEPGAASEPFIKMKGSKGRLYRDSQDKLLGGVCAGIANYMNIDPALIRLLFAIITFGGFGFGIFLYLLAWIILPAKSLDGYVGKRLFRNPEDRMIGGVAGGLAAYFNKETWMIRLIFAAPLLLNIIVKVLNGIFHAFHSAVFPNLIFGSFTGTFILAYIILWIVLPEARSPFEKMEMRGEKVDVNRIRQNVQEGMGDFKTRAQAWGEEVKASAQQFSERASNFANTRGRTFATEFSQSAAPVANSFGHIIGVIFKAFFLFVAGTIAFALFVLLLVFALSGIARPIHDYIIDGFWQNASLWGVIILFLAVPLIGLITTIVRRVMNVRSQNKYLGWVFGGLWTLGWVALMIFIASLVRDFRYSNGVTTSVPIANNAPDKMVVRIDEPGIRYSGTFDWINDNDDDGGWDITEDTLRIANVKIRVVKSEDSFYHASVIKYSNGRTRNGATNRAEKLQYTATTMDSVFIIGSGFGIGKSEKFRNQRIVVEIKVPVGKRIQFDESVAHKLNTTHIRVGERRNSWRRGNWEMDWDDDRFYNWEPNVEYIMTPDGELINANRTITTSTGVYEYRKDTTNNIDEEIERLQRRKEERERQYQQEIESQRRKIEEEQRRLEEMQRNRDKGRTSFLKIINTEKGKKVTANRTMSHLHSPVLSLTI